MTRTRRIALLALWDLAVRSWRFELCEGNSATFEDCRKALRQHGIDPLTTVTPF